ncbi:hypothetical protein RND81_02G210300 [Saponaria officinalis]|uniref:Uncharacterized protein n=1 Tax=Saponaria officinalis TaxID=3572 RepID=A0AAW1MWL8_SAPOF
MITEPQLCDAKSSSMEAEVLDSVRVKRKFFGPEEKFTHRRNTVFLVACLVSLFVDPLFIFLPSVRKDMSCIQNDCLALKVILTVTRSVEGRSSGTLERLSYDATILTISANHTEKENEVQESNLLIMFFHHVGLLFLHLWLNVKRH